MNAEAVVRALQSSRRTIAAGVLAAGLVIACVLYAGAPPPSADGEEWPANEKPYLRQMELYGGKANILASELREWFAGLWHGRPLAYTVAILSALSAGLTLFVLDPARGSAGERGGMRRDPWDPER